MSRIGRWLDARAGLSSLRELGRKKTVPRHRHSFLYYTGGLALLFLLVQLASGALLVLYYHPTLEDAHASVTRIAQEIPFGWAVRSLHHWGASAMIAAVIVHLAATWWGRAYRPPRELTWITGVGLLGLTLAFGFTGYLLPWDELSLAATKVGTDIPRSIPVVGEIGTRCLRGGPDVTEDTLTRFFGAHVAILPLLLLGILGAHVWLVQQHGMSSPPSAAPRPGPPSAVPFWPGFLLRELILWMLLGGLLATVAILWPPPLGPAADLLAPAPEGIRPEWYFLFAFQTLKLVPARVLGIEGETVAVLAMGAVGALVLLLPLLDPKPTGLRHRLATAFAGAFAAWVLVMTVWSLAT